MTWWLISNDDVKTIKGALLGNGHVGAVNAEVTCSEHGCSGCAREKKLRQARHTLDTGLHITGAIPGDYQ